MGNCKKNYLSYFIELQTLKIIEFCRKLLYRKVPKNLIFEALRHLPTGPTRWELLEDVGKFWASFGTYFEFVYAGKRLIQYFQSPKFMLINDLVVRRRVKLTTRY